MLTETPEFLSKVREAGYDGLVGYDEGVKYIAVMSPGQLKDAYENTGAFSTSMTTSASVRSITAVRPPSVISTMPLPEPVKGRRPTDGGHT